MVAQEKAERAGGQAAPYVIERAAIENRDLLVQWGDGHRSRYHPFWLRHQCRCPDCGSPVNAIRNIYLEQIPEDITPRLEAWARDRVQLCWTNDGHGSRYEAVWLRDNCPSEAERAKRRHRPKLWDGRMGANPPTTDFEAADADPKARLAMLEAVNDYGFCKVENLPGEFEESHRLIRLVGDQRQTHYGSYTLSKKASADNVGDITSALRPHFDETYRLSGIGITVFEVFNPAASGGASTLVDGFEAVRRFRAAWPEDFERLCRTPVATQRYDAATSTEREPKWFMANLPLIRLDSEGEVVGLRLNERQIGPLDLPAEEVGPCYRALKRIFEILYDPDLQLTFPLRAGEGLLFNNQRVLHGRTAFRAGEAEDAPRSVLTSSVDLEEFYSTLRLLKWQVEGTTRLMIYPQGMVG
ncbi:MAG: TauD/TfdA family dioxygenase [Pseudomonadota bacterium]